MKYPKEYSSPALAKRHLFEQQHEAPRYTCEVGTQTGEMVGAIFPITPSNTLNKLSQMIMLLPDEAQLETLSQLFSYFASHKHNVRIGADFLELVVNASEHLHQCGRSNVVYGVAKAIGRKRPDGSDSRLPAKRMPMGLLEHMVNFYNADSYPKVNR